MEGEWRFEGGILVYKKISDLDLQKILSINPDITLKDVLAITEALGFEMAIDLTPKHERKKNNAPQTP